MSEISNVAKQTNENSVSINAALQAELVETTKRNACSKHMLETLENITHSDIYEKPYRVTGKGVREYVQYKWQHFILLDHYKDQSTKTYTKTAYDRDKYFRLRNKRVVDVQTVTTRYDFFEVKDQDGEVFTVRLVDIPERFKFKQGQTVTLGWLFHHRSNTPVTDATITGSEIGQIWSNQVQPCVILAHPDPERPKNTDYVAKNLSRSEFNSLLSSTTIGWWHLAWLTVPLGGIGFLIIIVKTIQHYLKQTKFYEDFNDWHAQQVIDIHKAGQKIFKDYWRN